MKIADIATAIAPKAEQKIIGIRPGEKMHEQMIGLEDAPHTYEYDDYFKILPSINGWSSDPERIGFGSKVPQNFCYTSNKNPEWMSRDELKLWLTNNANKIDLI